MWSISGPPHSDDSPPGGYDGTWHKWPLRRGDDESFTMVKMSRHAEMRAGDLSPRADAAVSTDGRSEVEHYLGWETPPRVVEVVTGGRDPIITPR